MTFYKPMLAKIAPKQFSSKDWLFEIKWDGYRAIAYVKDNFSLRSRNGHDLQRNFPELKELKKLAKNVVLDGEIIIMKNGKQDFLAMQKRGGSLSAKEIESKRKTNPAMYVVFDILEKDGKSLLKLALIERKEILKKAVKEGSHVVIS
jgi:ATP-dependent DNA ligase